MLGGLISPTTVGMTANAIGKVTDALSQVSCGDLVLVVLMAAITGVIL